MRFNLTADPPVPWGWSSPEGSQGRTAAAGKSSSSGSWKGKREGPRPVSAHYLSALLVHWWVRLVGSGSNSGAGVRGEREADERNTTNIFVISHLMQGRSALAAFTSPVLGFWLPRKFKEHFLQLTNNSEHARVASKTSWCVNQEVVSIVNTKNCVSWLRGVITNCPILILLLIFVHLCAL